MNYDDWTAFDLAEALELSGEQPDADLLEALLAHDESVVPELMRLLKADVDDDWSEDDPRNYRDMHAGLVLIERKAPEVLAEVERFCREEPEKTRALGFWINPRLRRFGADAVAALEGVLDDPETPDVGRLHALQALGHLAKEPSLRDRIVPRLREMLPPVRDDGTPDVPDDLADVSLFEIRRWTTAVKGLMHARDVDSRERIAALYDAEVIMDWELSKDDALDMIASDEAPDPLLALPAYYEEMWAKEAEYAERVQELQAEMEFNRIASQIQEATGLPDDDVMDLMDRMMDAFEASGDEEPDEARMKQVIGEFMADRGLVAGRPVDEDEPRRKIGRNDRVVVQHIDTGETQTLKYKHFQRKLSDDWDIIEVL
ncbi:MAG: hypothetical protein GVY18_08225 [Bacteroidetes bacterium]|nr:hypothetical protein [Bacteroidota bacterium]